MGDTVKRMEKEFDNFMKHYREMDADEFIKELEEAGITFEKTDDDKNEIVDCHYCEYAMCHDANGKVDCYVDDFAYFDHHVEDSSEAQNCSWFYFCDTFPKC